MATFESSHFKTYMYLYLFIPVCDDYDLKNKLVKS